MKTERHHHQVCIIYEEQRSHARRHGHAIMIGNLVASAGGVASRKEKTAAEGKRGRATSLSLIPPSLHAPLLHACHRHRCPNEIRARESDTHGTAFTTADVKQCLTQKRPRLGRILATSA